MYSLFWVLPWLFGSRPGQLALLVAALWYLDNRYFGLLAALWIPIRRFQQVSALRQAVDVNPSDVRSMVELGDHYLHGGRPQVAAEYLERAFSRGEDGARALYLLGAAWVKLGRHEEGRARLEAALAKTPKVAFGEPYLYLMEGAFATHGPQSPRVDELVAELDEFDSVEVLTRAGGICGAAGRHDLARRLLTEAVRNYGYVPKRMRRRERRWLVRARLYLLQIR
jgi:tetratricopeptide (TPR) repeat protein